MSEHVVRALLILAFSYSACLIFGVRWGHVQRLWRARRSTKFQQENEQRAANPFELNAADFRPVIELPWVGANAREYALPEDVQALRLKLLDQMEQNDKLLAQRKEADARASQAHAELRALIKAATDAQAYMDRIEGKKRTL